MASFSVAELLSRALQAFDAALDVRAETDADFDFVCALYAQTREEELAAVEWPAAAKRDFLDSQCRLQRDHYLLHYRGADRLLIERGSQPIGRVYVHAKPKEIRLMDIALLRDQRRRGIGTSIVRSLQEEARRLGAELSLHVEPTNPAQRIYARLGFRLVENRGIYDFLSWSPSTNPATSQAS